MSNYYRAVMNTATYEVIVPSKAVHKERAEDWLKRFKNSKLFKAGVYSAGQFESVENIKASIAFNMQPLEHSRPHLVINKYGDIWSYYADLKEAQQVAIERTAEDESKTNQQWNKAPYTVTDWPTYEAMQRAKYVTETQECHHDYYWELLECLPPKNWGTHKGIRSFFMSEFTTGSYTQQLAEHDGKYYCKSVDYLDRSTWMTLDSLENAPYCTRSDEWAKKEA